MGVPCHGTELRQRGAQAARVRRGKHAKYRIVPIGERVLGWIERYLGELWDELGRLPDDGTVFLTQAGEALTGNRLSELVGGYLADAGHSGSCHLFRTPWPR